MTDTYDMLVIGGGVNGAGIARDAAGRGLSVFLCEKDDLAGATSSASSKLIHGGLRYLENYEFKLVHEALREREVLLNMAPHIISPMRFVLPVDETMRPAWMLRTGLFIYDHLARRRTLKGTETLDLCAAPQGEPLKDTFAKGYAYSDCWADDARLVVLNACAAQARGARIETRTRCTRVVRGVKHWTATMHPRAGAAYDITARIVVNAAGPWVDETLGLMGKPGNRGHVRLVKGSHIVTRRLYAGDHAYIFQSADRRVIFAIPYEHDYTLIGTTEQDWSLSMGEPEISAQETHYLCDAVSHYFKTPVTPGDVAWSYAGVRPLYDDHADDASVVTRDYVFDLDAGDGRMAPSLSIFGGKLTTYRKLAEQAVDAVSDYCKDIGAAWTAGADLPGGDFDPAAREALIAQHQRACPWMDVAQVRRMTLGYGTLFGAVVGDARAPADLGRDFGAGLSEAEVRYLVTNEFARAADDILWRRTKLGLHMSEEERGEFADWFAGQDQFPTGPV